MREFDTVKKAILLESSYILDTKKDPGTMTPETLHQVVAFYVQVNRFFTVGVNGEELTDDLSGDQRIALFEEIKLWTLENNIPIYRTSGPVVFHFTNEEDASAFKLRWF